MEGVMTKIQALVLSVGLAIGMAAPASAATTDPEVIIYRFPGVFDDGSATGAGFATMFNCTIFSGVPENVRFVTRNFDSSITGNTFVTIPHLNSRRTFTHAAAFIGGEDLLSGRPRGGPTAGGGPSHKNNCPAADH